MSDCCTVTQRIMAAERAKWTFEESPDGKLVRRPSRLLALERKANAERAENAKPEIVKAEKVMEEKTAANGVNAEKRVGEGMAEPPSAAKKANVEPGAEAKAEPEKQEKSQANPKAKAAKPGAKPDKAEAKPDKAEAKLGKPEAKPDKPEAEPDKSNPEAKPAAKPEPEREASEAQPGVSATLAPASPPAKHERVDVIFNPVSGHGDVVSDRETIKSILGERFGSVNFYETTPEESAGALADAALADGATLVVASGGDGTVTAVAAAVRRHADAVADSNRAEGNGTASLGVIPRGTANAFCAAVGIPSDVAAAARLVNGAKARPFDIAVVNGGEPMMLLAGVGLEAEAVNRADRGLKNRFGILAYVLAGAQSVAVQETFSASLTLRGVRQRQRVGSADAELVGDDVRLICPEVTVVTVANSAPVTSVLAHGVGPVSPVDGLLNVVCVSPPRRRAMVGAIASMLWSGLVGQPSSRGDVYGLRARSVEINCEPKQRVVVDGEDCGYTPVVVELEEREDRRQISVVAPSQEPLNRQKRRLGRALGRGWRNLRGAVVLGVVVWGLRKWSSMQGEEEL